MSTSCEIIQDLLPLYYDNVCSTESRALIDEHIKTCSSCKAALAAISEELVHPVNTMDETRFIRSMRMVEKKIRTKSFIKGIVLTIVLATLICSVLFIGYLKLIRWNSYPVPVSLLQVSDVSQLADGRIVYHLTINDGNYLPLIGFTTDENGSRYATPFRYVIERKRKTDDDGPYVNYNVMDIEGANACYVGPVGDGILIWQKGMELPAASIELEKAFPARVHDGSIGKGE